MDGRDSAAPTQAGPADAPAMRSVSSSDLHLIVAGIRIEPELRDDSFVFPLMLPCADLRLMSRSARPYDIGLGEDTRQLGYRVRALTLLCGGQQMPIPLDHPGLVQGFHQVEHNGMRWTDGAASLPDAVFAVGNGPHQRNTSPRAVALQLRGIVGWTGRQTHAAMHALLENRVVQALEPRVGEIVRHVGMSAGAPNIRRGTLNAQL